MRTCEFDLSARGIVMGILNVTPDSFSDGGRHHGDPIRAAEHALAMAADGAEVIDIGGESTRPGAAPVAADVEHRRVVPVVKCLRSQSSVAISVDTSKASVAAAALDAGADIINDVTALRGDPDMPRIAAESGAGVVLMHMRGTPRTMQRAPDYGDVAGEVMQFLAERTDAAEGAGIARPAIAIDPGIGFGKTVEHNLALLRELPRLTACGLPVMVGVSRKSFLAKVIGSDDIERRVGPTAALTAWCRDRGARIFRVHDVGPNVRSLRVIEAVLGESGAHEAG